MATIQIRTEIPGPRSRALMARREAAVPRGPANATPVFAARADGATIEDVDGNRYIDFAGGIGCLNIGHRSPRVISAIQEQLEKYLHLCFAVTPYEGYVAVAEKLNSLAPGNFAKKTILLNSGRRSHRKRRQDRARLHKASRRHLLRRRFPRPHASHYVAHEQDASLQGGFPAVCQRHLSHPLRISVSQRIRARRPPTLRIISKTRSNAPSRRNPSLP